MLFDKLADKRIREAMSEGKFDHLPRRGAIDLDDYFKMPADRRMGYSILKSAGFVPEEVELLREVDRLRNAIAPQGVKLAPVASTATRASSVSALAVSSSPLKRCT